MADRARSWRWFVAGVVGALGVLFVAPTAHADPAEPTDYRSEVVGVEPATATIEARIVGGDSFFELRVDEGTEAFVLGYQNEQYLWFRADGEVFENRNAPSTYLNGSRFGGQRIPDTATADAEPDWERVASAGSWVWHDHRSHWMQESRPVGFEPGDQILDSTIPLVVGGTPVDVRVVSTWQAAPSMVPVWLGAAAGVAVVAAAWILRRRATTPIVALLPATLLVLLVGAWQYRSLPAATQPRAIWIVLPVIAVVCAIAGTVAGRRGAAFVADASVLVVGVELAVWGFVKRDGLSAAIVPTDAPMWLDRFTTALAITGGAASAACALWWLFASTASPEVSGSREPTDSPSPARL